MNKTKGTKIARKDESMVEVDILIEFDGVLVLTETVMVPPSYLLTDFEDGQGNLVTMDGSRLLSYESKEELRRLVKVKFEVVK